VIQFPLELDEVEDLPEQKQTHGNRKPARNRAGSGSLINIVAIGKLAEAKLNLQSGQHLLIVGRLNQRSWKTPEGKHQTRTEVIATDLRTIEETKPNPCPFTGKIDAMKRGEENEETG
jgi:single-stranded DNA-binding protein